MFDKPEKVPLSGEDTNKSVSVDYDTWQTLVLWSEEECRTIGGQIRWVVKQYAPVPPPEQELKPALLPDLSYKRFTPAPPDPDEPTWEVKRVTQPGRVTPKKMRYKILKVLKEVGEPCNNTALHVYLMAEFPGLETTADLVGSHMSNLFTRGLVQRRKTTDYTVKDRFQYILSRKGEQTVRKYE